MKPLFSSVLVSFPLTKSLLFPPKFLFIPPYCSVATVYPLPSPTRHTELCYIILFNLYVLWPFSFLYPGSANIGHTLSLCWLVVSTSFASTKQWKEEFNPLRISSLIIIRVILRQTWQTSETIDIDDGWKYCSLISSPARLLLIMCLFSHAYLSQYYLISLLLTVELSGWLFGSAQCTEWRCLFLFW